MSSMVNQEMPCKPTCSIYTNNAVYSDINHWKHVTSAGVFQPPNSRWTTCDYPWHTWSEAISCHALHPSNLCWTKCSKPLASAMAIKGSRKSWIWKDLEAVTGIMSPAAATFPKMSVTTSQMREVFSTNTWISWHHIISKKATQLLEIGRKCPFAPLQPPSSSPRTEAMTIPYWLFWRTFPANVTARVAL